MLADRLRSRGLVDSSPRHAYPRGSLSGCAGYRRTRAPGRSSRVGRRARHAPARSRIRCDHGDDGRRCSRARSRPVAVAFILRSASPRSQAYKDTSVAMMRAAADRGARAVRPGAARSSWDGERDTLTALALRSPSRATTTIWYSRRATRTTRRSSSFLVRGRAHAQGPAVRHGVRIFDATCSRSLSAKGRASSTGRAPSARSQREDGHRKIHGVHGSDARHPRRRS